MPSARPVATSRKAAFWSGNDFDCAFGNVFCTSCSAVEPWRDVIVLLESFQAAMVPPVVPSFRSARIWAYGTYDRLNVIAFFRTGVAERPTETMSNFFA